MTTRETPEEIPQSMKQWIDAASYEELLSRWRYAPVGSPWFQGVVGKYYDKIMRERAATTPHEEKVAASKKIGWD